MPAPDDNRMEESENGDLPTASIPNKPIAQNEELVKIIKTVENAPLIENDTWYIVSQEWWNKFTECVSRKEVKDIPEIDNSTIIATDHKNKTFLRKKLVEGADFQSVPESVFKRLCDLFGISEDSHYLPRKVVKKAGVAVIEIYPRIVCIELARNRNIKSELVLKPNDTMESLRARAMQELDISDKKNVRFYVMNSGMSTPELVDTTLSIDTYFDTAQNVLVDIEEDGEYFYKQQNSARPKSLFGNNSSALGNGMYGMSSFSSSSSYNQGSKSSPGVCGLSNLGNTCFMNSSLQCLSNMPPIRDYFLSDAYKNDLNDVNPLGTHGNLAQAVGLLLKEMWSGNASYSVPRHFKSVIGEFAPRFNGYSQQDSHELMAYVLDGLHEDLNRIRDKPYFEDNDELAKLPIHEYAEKSWEMYQKRNDSIIVDTLHGQLKSTLVCPVCEKISIKFDPFGYLSLPLPQKEQLISQKIVVIFKDRKWAKFSFKLTQTTKVREAEEMIRGKLQIENPYYLVFYYLPNPQLDEVCILKPDENISQGMRDVYACEVDLDPKLPSTKMFITTNCHKLRLCTLPIIHTISADFKLTRSYLTGPVLDITVKLFFVNKNGLEALENESEEMNEEDSEPYSISMFPHIKHLPATMGENDPIELPEYTGADGRMCPKFSFRWKDLKLFNQYKGADLVEREMQVNTRRKVHLMETVDWFTTKEQLGEHDLWYCPKCKEHRRATKQLDLWKLPEILILHLKRFQYSRHSRDKLTWDVVIPVRGLDLTSKIGNDRHGNAVYDLIGLSRHYGSLSGGHYTATCYNDKLNRWVDFNDQSASSAQPPSDPYESCDPYMLVYRRRPLDENGKPMDPSISGYPSNDYRKSHLINKPIPHSSDENMDMEVDED